MLYFVLSWLVLICPEQTERQMIYPRIGKNIILYLKKKKKNIDELDKIEKEMMMDIINQMMLVKYANTSASIRFILFIPEYLIL